MGFGLLGLFRFNLNNELVPDYQQVKGKSFPERMPLALIVLCFINSLVKLLIPLILEQTYSSMSNSSSSGYITLITTVVVAIAASQLILIAYTLMLTLYRLNVKRQLSMRMLSNNFRDYRQMLEGPAINENLQSYHMQLRIKISTKLSVYLHNYYESYLSLIFECFNVVVIFIYLVYKLSFSLFFGVAIAGLVMYKTIVTAAEMNVVRFKNIALRAKRLKILEEFFNQLTEFKMCWLDKWIYDKITKIENQFLSGLRKVKMLDCWCVALWQFTSVGISSVVVTAYFLLGLHQNIDKDSVFSPSTFVYLLGMLNFPLNALSWYIAGIKTAHRAIQEIKNDIRLTPQKKQERVKITSVQGGYVIPEEIKLQLEIEDKQKKEEEGKIIKTMLVPKYQIRKHRIYSVTGAYAERFMEKFVFLMDQPIVKGFVQENSWLSLNPLEAIRMETNIANSTSEQRKEILKLMELFQCGDIPINTSTKNYSGGEKLRMSLVRAFHLGSFIVINTNLNSLDAKMQRLVKQNLVKLVKGRFKDLNREYTVFIRDNADISDSSFELKQEQGIIFTAITQLKPQENELQQTQSITISSEIRKFKAEFSTAIEAARKKLDGRIRRYSVDKLSELDKMQQRSLVSFNTFRLYYKSKKHIIFFISLAFVTLLSNYYNYYINTYINLTECNQSQIVFIIGLTVAFAVGLYFRAYYFADANLDEAHRICHNVNKNILMNQLQYYQSEPSAVEDDEAINSKHKLICVLTSDNQIISDRFPFDTNIFANNIVMILSSMIVIVIEVPPVIIIMFFLVMYANYLNKVSHKKDQFLKIATKEKDVDIYKIMSQMQDGKKYLVIHNKVEEYSQIFSKYHEELYSIDWLNEKFKGYINLKYKTVMILFLIVAVVLYSFMNVFNSEDIIAEGTTLEMNTKQSSGLALLIQYTIQLSNYLLFFTMSIWDIKGQAVSIERSKPFIEETPSIKNRIESAEKIIGKMKSTNEQKIKEGDVMMKIEKLNFAYELNPGVLIFKDLELLIRKGDKIMIKGRSGSGKTTLYKLLSSTYPQIMSYIDHPFVVYFSPQHPLVLPDTATVQENLNPYGIEYNRDEIETYMNKYQFDSSKALSDLNYQQKIVINNLRAYLYGGKGVIIYDEPQLVIEDQKESTYLIVTHHHEFKHNVNLLLEEGALKQVI